MATIVLCCHPDQSCSGHFAPFDCSTIGACFLDYVFTGDPANACAFWYSFNPPGSVRCDTLGACIHDNGQCERAYKGSCCADAGDQWQPGPCPRDLNIHVDMFPMRRRAWPYKMEFACAWKGVCNGLCSGGRIYLRRYHAFDQAWYHNPLSIDNQVKSQIGRFVVERKNRNCVDAEGVIIPGPGSQESCESVNGFWKWDGVPYFTPSINLVAPTENGCYCYMGSPPPFNKCPVLTCLGFWFPKRKFCVDPVTLLVLPYDAPAECVAFGGTWQDQTTILRPPLWRGAWRASSGATHPANVPKVNVGETNQDWVGANEYQWMVLLPVEPISELPPTCCSTNCVPYCATPNADELFPFHENFTYEIPNYTRDYEGGGFGAGEPYRNITLGEVALPSVPAGVLGIVAHSGSDAQDGTLPVYCNAGAGYGCPELSGCQYTYCKDLFENVWRRYRGVTDQKRYEWTDDPEHRGWWVEYITEIWAWFVQDAAWMNIVIPRPLQRWNAWYQGQTRAIIPRAAKSLPNDFKDWVLTHDSGFGIDFEPRYPKCNDVLAKYEKLTKALGDELYPSAAAQDACHLPIGEPPTDQPPPCRDAGAGYGYWYRLTGSTPAPEQGLYHETVRKRFTAMPRTMLTPNNPPPRWFPPLRTGVFTTEYGWAKLAFTTGPPCLVAA